MTENKSQNTNALINEIIERAVVLEAENFFFRAALSLAKATPSKYGTTAQLFEECLVIVRAESDRFDRSSAHHASVERLQELARLLVPRALR